MHAIQTLLILLYAVTPPVALVFAVAWQRDRRRGSVLGSWFGVFFASAFLVYLLIRLTGWILGGHAAAREFFLLFYLLMGALLLLRGVDWLLMYATFSLLRLRTRAARAQAPIRSTLGLLFERAIFLAIAIPYLAGMLAIYRPRLVTSATPHTVLKASYDDVQFQAADGTDLSGWWIPATPAPPGSSDRLWGYRTLIVCPGLASDASHQLPWLRSMLDGGFNVLVFDCRAQGRSEGRLTGFGASEWQDVLAAVRWVRTAYPDQSQRLCALGINTGAAAVLAAATRPGEGHEIDAVVLVEPYADLAQLAKSNAIRAFPRPVSWLVRHIGLPIASAHLGTDLASFAPATFAADLWDRPMLIVHGPGRSFIPVYQEMEVFQHALQPKQEYWPPADYQEDREPSTVRDELRKVMQELLDRRATITGDPVVQQRILRFLRDSHRQPIL